MLESLCYKVAALKAPTQVFFCEYCQIFKNSFYYRIPWYLLLNLFKVSNKEIRTKFITSFWCLYCSFRTGSTQWPRVSIFDFDFEQVIVCWEYSRIFFHCGQNPVDTVLRKNGTAHCTCFSVIPNLSEQNSDFAVMKLTGFIMKSH